MAALWNSSVLKSHSLLHLSSGCPFNPMDQYCGSSAANNLSFRSIKIVEGRISSCRRALAVQAGAGHRDSGRSGNSATFVGGFLLGGIIFGTLGCVYAPQISKALLGPERNELVKKPPKYKSNEEKALEET